MAWEVEDLETVVATLSERGVVFETVDLPGLRTVNGIAEITGNYPGKRARGERGAWFRDSEGNLLGIGEAGGLSSGIGRWRGWGGPLRGVHGA
jgi:hypothetical protein